MYHTDTDPFLYHYLQYCIVVTHWQNVFSLYSVGCSVEHSVKEMLGTHGT